MNERKCNTYTLGKSVFYTERKCNAYTLRIICINTKRWNLYRWVKRWQKKGAIPNFPIGFAWWFTREYALKLNKKNTAEKYVPVSWGYLLGILHTQSARAVPQLSDGDARVRVFVWLPYSKKNTNNVTGLHDLKAVVVALYLYDKW